MTGVEDYLTAWSHAAPARLRLGISQVIWYIGILVTSVTQ
jgi:hypothetical protein